MKQSISSNRSNRRLRSARPKRAGVACVEAACLLPVILLVVLGSVEVTNKIFLKQSLATAAYESCRTAIESNAKNELAISAGMKILTARGVKSATITFDPENIEKAKRGEFIRVTVHSDGKANSILNNDFTVAGDVSCTIVMTKE
ncbi:MAG: TadE/TadG family type IV pilus assembly protein [Pirellula sp.]|jgi:Flp pilus assembly protein TadG|nr:pilus assembly protein [Pirellula sp.]